MLPFLLRLVNILWKRVAQHWAGELSPPPPPPQQRELLRTNWLPLRSSRKALLEGSGYLQYIFRHCITGGRSSLHQITVSQGHRDWRPLSNRRDTGLETSVARRRQRVRDLCSTAESQNYIYDLCRIERQTRCIRDLY